MRFLSFTEQSPGWHREGILLTSSGFVYILLKNNLHSAMGAVLKTYCLPLFQDASMAHSCSYWTEQPQTLALYSWFRAARNVRGSSETSAPDAETTWGSIRTHLFQTPYDRLSVQLLACYCFLCSSYTHCTREPYAIAKFLALQWTQKFLFSLEHIFRSNTDFIVLNMWQIVYLQCNLYIIWNNDGNMH